MLTVSYARSFSRLLVALLFSLTFTFAQVQSPDAIVPATMGPAPRIEPAEKLQIEGIKNAGKVNELLYRGAQPSLKGLTELKKLGVAIVVDLRETGDHQIYERNVLESLGMSYVPLPSSTLTGPSDQQVAQFLKLRRDNPDKKIFVHCNLGSDRTGVMIASYRMIEQKWTPDQAFNEMRNFHFHEFLFVMSRHVKHFPEHFSQDPAYAPFRTPAPKN